MTSLPNANQPAQPTTLPAAQPPAATSAQTARVETARAGGPGASSAPTGSAPSFIDMLRNWAVRASVLASATSVLLHISLIALATAVTVGLVTRESKRADSSGELILALTPEVELAEVSDVAIDAASPSVSAGTTEIPEVATPGIDAGPGGDDAPASGPGFGPIGEGLGGAGGGDIGDGTGLGSGGAGGGASFFGVEAQGSRFAYVLDTSGSMQGEKLAALKIELGESIQGLREHMSFYVVLFSSDSAELGGRNKWTLATVAGKRWANDAMSSIEAAGGTQPWSGLERALQMKPAPDAIFFMTDGEFDPGVVDLISMRNRGAKKIPINTIAFGDAAAEEIMRKIATDSGGTYRHVAGPK